MIGEDSGLHILLKVHNGMREEELIQEAAKYSIKIYPVSTYYKDGTAPENVVLLGFCDLIRRRNCESDSTIKYSVV